MYLLSHELWFPPVEEASIDGLLAIGGDLSAERLKLAYKKGIFPWFSEGEPVVWYSPDPRMVLFPSQLKISKSMRQVIRKGTFKATFNTNFKAVIANCKNAKRNGEVGTWITDEMEQAYIKLHEQGIAKSVEVWQDNALVGGLYGVDLGTVFCGESMFSKVSNASKFGFVFLVELLKRKEYKLLDCQVYNAHLASLGAEEISRIEFLKYI